MHLHFKKSYLFGFIFIKTFTKCVRSLKAKHSFDNIYIYIQLNYKKKELWYSQICTKLEFSVHMHMMNILVIL